MSEKRKQRGFTELTPAQQAAIVDGAYGFVRGEIAPTKNFTCLPRGLITLLPARFVALLKALDGTMFWLLTSGS